MQNPNKPVKMDNDSINDECGWDEKFFSLERFIELYAKIPGCGSNAKVGEKQLKFWYINQKKNRIKCIGVFKDHEIRDQWDTFIQENSHIFGSKTLYLNSHKKRIHEDNIYDKVKKVSNKACMGCTTLPDMTCKEAWVSILTGCDKFIVSNGKYFIETDRENLSKISSSDDSDNTTQSIYYRGWIHTQFSDLDRRVGTVSEFKYRKMWDTFITKYDIKKPIRVKKSWNKSCDEYIQFVNENKRHPKTTVLGENRLRNWAIRTSREYTECKKAMAIPKNRDRWDKVVEKYKISYKSHSNEWNKKIKECERIFETHHHICVCRQVFMNCGKLKLYEWLLRQMDMANINTSFMKTQRKETWEKFVIKYRKFLPKYGSRAGSAINNTIVNIWKMRIEQLKKFIEKFHRRPRRVSKCDDERRLAIWTDKYVVSYNHNRGLMNCKDFRSMWETLITKYAGYMC